MSAIAIPAPFRHRQGDPMKVPPKPDPDFLQSLEEYVGLFRDVFRRRDQARWAFVYLQGLLLPGLRKNVESLSGRVVVPDDAGAVDVTQAVQNFVNQSPWDEQQLLRRFREVIARPLVTGESALVVEDLVLPKQGEHSVGVQRQHSVLAGGKLNCQIAVSVHLAGPAGYCPLAVRLYLPRNWCSDPRRLSAVGVPVVSQTFATRPYLALSLIDALRAEGFDVPTALAGECYATSEDLRHGLKLRRLAERPEGVPDKQSLLSQVGDGCRRLDEELGLRHFEGRSWRGFHHHTSLVMLAFGYRLWQGT